MDITIKMERGQAVLREPPHVRGQHDDARRGHPARDARARRGRLQRRGPQGERPPRRISSATSSRSRARKARRRSRATPGLDDRVDVKVKVEEQNRNQLAFGAGVSQFDGFFGQLSFQTSNFLGRGETVGVSLQKGSQARQYQVSFSEPYLFERPDHGRAPTSTAASTSSRSSTRSARPAPTTSSGFRSPNYTRGFMSYSFEQVSGPRRQSERISARPC